MKQFLFENEKDISSEWLTYIENEANSLAKDSAFEIENYLDREVLNPEMEAFLNEEKVGEWIADADDEGILALDYRAALTVKNRSRKNSKKFKKLKSKIRKIFCKIVRETEGIEIKDIISATIALILTGIGVGISPIILPIIISLVALLLKSGVDAVCPL